ncbi:M20/M25/M40 family metallo-hydrolase [Phycicoccus jejuensis]|uniref:M20/M25/M40 family metallo-hydrolase n=1 Tax=Phycicoccus jejuensis TaxID=367299 RepID=UPI00384EB238
MSTRDLGADTVALTAELVATDSVNPGLVPGAAGEAAVVDLLDRRLAASGFDTHRVTPSDHPDRPSLLAVGPGEPGTPCLVLTGHVDTVGTDGMDAPFTPVVDGDRLAGRGACDMKGGVAAVVVAAEELVRRTAPVRVVLALVADEEDLSLGTEAVLEALPSLGLAPDAALVAEPTWLARTASLRGYAVAEVTLTGRAAHSSQPEEGVNAVAHLGRLLAAVEERGHHVAASGGSLMVTVASGGESPFVLGRSARAVVERRTVAGEAADCVLAELDELLDGLRGRPHGRRPRAARRRARGLAARRRRAGRSVRRLPRRRARRRGRRAAPAPRRALLDGGPALAGGRRAGPRVRPRGRGTPRRRRVGRPRAGPPLHPRPRGRGRVVGERPCRLTRAGCGRTHPCSMPGCASTRRRRRRSPSPGTSSVTTSSATSWPGTSRSTPASTR